jgi:hypothetical protein
VIFDIALAIDAWALPRRKWMPINSRIGLLRRRAVWATGVIAALAVAAPVAQASADPTPALSMPALGELPAFGGFTAIDGLPAFSPDAFPFVVPAANVATAPPVIGKVFNGGTTVCVSPVSCEANTIP